MKAKKKELSKGKEEDSDQQEEGESNKQKYDSMVDTFKDEELGSGYDLNEADLFMNEQGKTLMTQKLNKRDIANSGIQNLEMRSLCIAAFLRCLFNSLEYAPDGEFYKNAIENLHSDILFKSVTQLCASTGWFEAQIGTKYIQVMRYLIRLPRTARFEKKKSILKYEILAIVIKRIMIRLRSKIKNENDNQNLEIQEKMLLSRLA